MPFRTQEPLFEIEKSDDEDDDDYGSGISSRRTVRSSSRQSLLELESAASFVDDEVRESLEPAAFLELEAGSPKSTSGRRSVSTSTQTYEDDFSS